MQLLVLGVITGTVFLRLDTQSVSAAISMLGVLFYDLVVLYVIDSMLALLACLSSCLICCLCRNIHENMCGDHQPEILKFRVKTAPCFPFLCVMFMLFNFLHSLCSGCFWAPSKFQPPLTACLCYFASVTTASTHRGSMSPLKWSSSCPWAWWIVACGQLSHIGWWA